MSLVCAIALWITWCILPKWRTLHNYVIVQHTTIGALNLMSLGLVFTEHFSVFILSYDIFFHASMSWSLASSLIAYFKLVLVHSVKISNEKTIITVFAFGLTIVSVTIVGVTSQIVYDLELRETAILGLFPLYLILMMKIFLFISVIVSVMSCCKRSMSRRKFGHVVALVGVALVSDIGTIVWVFLLLFLNYNIMDAWFYNRLIPQALFVLFNPSSRAHWKKLCSRRRRMNAVV